MVAEAPALRNGGTVAHAARTAGAAGAARQRTAGREAAVGRKGGADPFGQVWAWGGQLPAEDTAGIGTEGGLFSRGGAVRFVSGDGRPRLCTTCSRVMPAGEPFWCDAWPMPVLGRLIASVICRRCRDAGL